MQPSASSGQIASQSTQLRQELTSTGNQVVGDIAFRGAMVRDQLAAAHFHDTRGLGLANCYAALQLGMTRFDACTAGGLARHRFELAAVGAAGSEDLDDHDRVLSVGFRRAGS